MLNEKGFRLKERSPEKDALGVVTASSRVKAHVFLSRFVSNDARIETNPKTWSAPLRLFAYTDLNSVCYNSVTEQGQMFWIAAARGRYGSKFDVLSMLSISSGI